MIDSIKKSLNEANATMQKFISDTAVIESIEKAALLMAESLQKGGKIIACGNGGSLCDATHFAEELTGRFRKNRRPLPALSINDPGHITCVANDFGFEYIFSKYVEALGAENDILFAFSTSGNSGNVIRAAEAAIQKGMKVVGMTRKGENALSKIADIAIQVEHAAFADRIQEMHILAVHIIVECIEEKLGLNDCSML